jgi:hypothetical protein
MFRLVLTGAFDTISEFIPHVAIILYRVYPTSHVLLSNVFRTVCFTTIAGTISETVLVMYFFGLLWNDFSLGLRISTPILHIAFTAAQLHGTRIFYTMWRKQERLIGGRDDLEKSPGLQEGTEGEEEDRHEEIGGANT